MANAASDGSAAALALDNFPPEHVIFGQSDGMQLVQRRAKKVAAAQVPVLILGESGVGKEVVARYIHRNSPWRTGPFVKVNCPAIPGTLLESELFGYEKGAFTGAVGTKPGRVEAANGGVLFLDEIAEIEADLQAKLLQLLQDGRFSRIGGQEEMHTDLRVICATHRNLEDEIAAGKFRQDLYFRINVVSLRLLPLRERIGDIDALVPFFLDRSQKEFGREVPPFTAETLRLMRQYAWPGNIRELESLVKRYVILGTEDVLTTDMARSVPRPASAELAIPGGVSLKKMIRQATQELERRVILQVLKANNWNRKRAAQELNISYRALLYKTRQAGLPAKHLRARDDSPDRPSVSAD